MKRFFPVLFAAVVLAVACVVMARSFLSESAAAKHGHLIDALPQASGAWTQTEMDIASTEEMKQAVDELLNYDQAVFREYRNGARSFSLYVAHWEPRKFHPRLISIHTPDVCWVGNGWKMEAAEYAYPVALNGGEAWPAQYREFTVNGKRTYVLYWHLMNGKLSGYASGPASANLSFLNRLWEDVREGTGEQFFIRVSSEQPWDVWKDDPFFKQLLSTFSPVLASRPLE